MWHFARPHIYLAAVINQYRGREKNIFMEQLCNTTQVLKQSLKPLGHEFPTLWHLNRHNRNTTPNIIEQLLAKKMETQETLSLSHEEQEELTRSKKKVKNDSHVELEGGQGSGSSSPNHSLGAWANQGSFKDKLMGEIPGLSHKPSTLETLWMMMRDMMIK